jgi:hypothetical protein
MKYTDCPNEFQQKDLIEIETKRLSEKYDKDFLNCDDLIKITNLGRDNVRNLMRSKNFPLIKIGKRNVVSIVSFVEWTTRTNKGGTR